MKSKFILLGIFCSITFAADRVRVVTPGPMDVVRVSLHPDRATALSFPSKPNIVLSGSEHLFSIKYVGYDVVLKPRSPNAKSNILVYLPGRRFAFDLKIDSKNWDEIVMVRDGALFRRSK